MAQLARRLQKMSAILFGQADLLAIMDYISQSDDGLINPAQLAADLGLRTQSAIQEPLRDLEDANLITALPNDAGQTYYQRVNSLVWTWVRCVVNELTAVSPRLSP